MVPSTGSPAEFSGCLPLKEGLFHGLIGFQSIVNVLKSS